MSRDCVAISATFTTVMLPVSQSASILKLCEPIATVSINELHTTTTGGGGGHRGKCPLTSFCLLDSTVLKRTTIRDSDLLLSLGSSRYGVGTNTGYTHQTRFGR
jgi:hypothetical protein